MNSAITKETNRNRMRKLRLQRDRAKQCRICGARVAVSKLTGKPARHCRTHLDQDKERKQTIKLGVEAKPAIDTGLIGARRLPWSSKPAAHIELPWERRRADPMELPWE